jgi:ABC-type nitrate/sulfonate/bicarbonate transport system substrate-binding protein
MLRLKIGGVPEHFNLPWKLAIEEGRFREKNIYLHWEDIAGGTGQMVRGLENGSIDVAVLLTEGITKSILEGLDAKILQVYVLSPLRWGIHVPTTSAFQKKSDLNGKTFAISRTGSGSHLMSYVLADQEGWDTKALKFNVVGDIYGGLWSLENNEAQAFLWEKFTTKPHVDAGKCRIIDEVVTPWPCFCIAVRKEIYDKHPAALKDLCMVINTRAAQLKNESDAVEILAWRYNLEEEDVKQWFSQTEWNYAGAEHPEAFELTINYLLQLGLINEEQTKDYAHKLF